MSYKSGAMDERDQKILDFVKQAAPCSSKEVHEQLGTEMSYATLKRTLSKLVAENLLSAVGRGKGTKYRLSPAFALLAPVDVERYYSKEIDEREIKEAFDFAVINEVLAQHSVFTQVELEKLEGLQRLFRENTSQLTEAAYKNEFERLAIDLSWKSSQIEGNTYSLLETERLLKEKETAAGKTKEEAVMLLNHKDALDFLLENPDYLHPMSVAKIEDIHSMLTKELPVERNLRRRRVGISGTNYRPLDNEFQIAEALRSACEVINAKGNAFEKALLAIVLISYIQPFMDGNKRTARIVGNAILMNEGHCPLSFRTVDSIDYKKAILLFYEQNNISRFKEIFIQQAEFAVRTYF